MSLSYLWILLRCFGDVIMPNWFTVGILVAAILVFGVMKMVYGSKQISEQGALRQIGKRWQMVGVIILIAALVVYITECVIMYTVNNNIIANRNEPKNEEFDILLQLTEADLVKSYVVNIKKPEKFDAFAEKYEIREQVTPADRAKLQLAKKFSGYLKGSALKRFYKHPDYLAPRQLKVDSFRKIIERLGFDNTTQIYQQINACSDNLYTDPLYRDVIKNFRAQLQEAFDKDVIYTFDTFVSNGRRVTTLAPLKVFNVNLGVEMPSSTEKIMKLNDVLNRKATTDENCMKTFADLFGEEYCEEVRRAVRIAHEEVLSDLARISQIIQKNAKAVEAEKLKISEVEQVAEVAKRTNADLGRLWKEAMAKRVYDKLEGKEKLLYDNDEFEYSQLKQREKDLNRSLVVLWEISVWLKNLFWFVLLALAVLFLFFLRGRKLIALGNPQKIKNKIKG